MYNDALQSNEPMTLAEAADHVRNEVGCNLSMGKMYETEEMMSVLEQFAADRRLSIELHGGTPRGWTRDVGRFTRCYKRVVALHDEQGLDMLLEFLQLDMLLEFLQAEGAGLRERGKVYSDPPIGRDMAALEDAINGGTDDIHNLELRVLDAGMKLQEMRDHVFSPQAPPDHIRRRARVMREKYGYFCPTPRKGKKLLTDVHLGPHPA